MEAGRVEALEKEASRLLRPQGSLGLPVPDYLAGRTLPNVTASVVRALDAEISGAPALLPPLARDLDPFEGRRAEGPVVVFLLDALGWNATRAGGRPAGALPSAWSARANPIASVFPTTTTVALTSLSTGESPGRHGIVGHRVYLPEYGGVVEILRMTPAGVGPSDTLVGSEWTPLHVSGVANVFRRGLPAVALSRDRFEGTGFTRMLYDGSEFVAYSTAADFAHQLAELLGRARPPSAIYAYWDELDTVQHLRGPRPEFAAFEAGQVARILTAAAARLDPGRARRTTVILSSDHGQVPAERSQEVAIDREPSIASHLLYPPTGDRRAGFLRARPGELEALEQALRERLPEGSRVVPMAEAIDAGLFGPPPYHLQLAERLGDLLVLVPPPAALTYRAPGSTPRPRYLVGAHGGLHPDELLVPLVAGSLAELTIPVPDPS